MSETNALAVLPISVVFAQCMENRITALPLEPSQLEKIRVPFTLLWHKRNSYNPKIVWLRETLRQLYIDPL